MLRVAVLDDYQDVARKMTDWSVLPADVEVAVFRDHLTDQAAVAKRLKDFDIVMAMRERTPFPRTLLEAVVTVAIADHNGHAQRRHRYCRPPQTARSWCAEPAVILYPTAELTWGLILSLLRHIPDEDHATRAGSWQVSMGLGLNGKTLGLMGLGRLGSEVARVGNAFHMDVIAWSQNLTAERAG